MRTILALLLAGTFLAGQVLDGWDENDDCLAVPPSGQFDDFADAALSGIDVPRLMVVPL